MSSVTTSSPREMHTSSSRKLTLLNPLNLHFAALALLFIVNAYLLVQLVFLWQKVRSNDARAIAQQQIALETAKVGAEPLRGLDTKLADATHDADAFYTHRLPATDSEVLTELGAITKQHNVKLTRGQYLPAPVLAGTAGELTEMRIDASLSGDYRPLVQVINALERDRMFFLINGVSLSGQQTGTVNLRLSLTTYLRGHVIGDDAQGSAQSTSGEIGPQASAAAGEVSPR